MNNATVRLEHFGKLKLKWRSKESVSNKALCDVLAYEAAGVETHLKRKHQSDEEWHEMMEKTVKAMIKEQQSKKRYITPPAPANTVLRKRTKKQEEAALAKRKDDLSRPPHFWESFGSHAEK